MIVALHGPNGVSFSTESFSSVSSHSGINQHRNRVYIQREGSRIVMIVAFIIKSAFSSDKHSALVLHMAEFRFGIPCHIGYIMFRNRLRQFMTEK